MNRSNRIAAFILTTLLLSGALFPLQSQSKKNKIKSEIYIMETILDQLLQASRENLFEGKNIKGFYLDDFGLVFTVNLEINFWSVYSFSGNRIDIGVGRNRDKKDIVRDAGRAYAFAAGSMDSSQVNQWLGKLNKKMSTFLGTYVDINNHMDLSENVGVLVSFNNIRRNQPLGKFYQVAKKDIVDFRNDKITKDRFTSKINQQSIDDSKELEEITVMGAILKTSLSEKRTHFFFNNRNINGVYIKNLGVMFTVGGLSLIDDIVFDGFIPPAIFSPRAEAVEEFVVSKRKRQEENQKKVKDKISDYKIKIVKIIGDYGPSLRFLPANQSIIVLLGTDSGYSEIESSNILIRIKKDDVMKYSQRKLDLQSLLKLAQYEEY